MSSDHPPYPVGLRLAGRRVVVVGGGHVAQRRVPALVASGADVVVVSPVVTPALEGMAGEVDLVLRRFEDSDLDAAWYVVAATDDPEVNAAVLAGAQLKIFSRLGVSPAPFGAYGPSIRTLPMCG